MAAISTDALIQRIGQAKAAIDNGFSRVGPKLQGSGPTELALFGASGRMVRSANAVVLLCKTDHAEEAKPLLKAMASIAFVMRWLATKRDSGAIPADLDSIWIDGEWSRRFTSAGIEEKDLRFVEEAFRDRRTPFADSWAAGLPWAHIAESTTAEVTTDEILDAACLLLDHALRALRTCWPKAFGAEK